MPKLFNVLVDAVVCEWLQRMFGCKVARLGIGADLELVRTFLALIYVDNGYLASRDPELRQESVDTLVELFEHVGLLCNTKKMQAMVCVPDKIRVQLSSASYHRLPIGRGLDKTSCGVRHVLSRLLGLFLEVTSGKRPRLFSG